MYACHLQHASEAELPVGSIHRADAELGRKIDGGPGRSAFIQYFIANKPDVHGADSVAPWAIFVKQQISGMLHEGDLTVVC